MLTSRADLTLATASGVLLVLSFPRFGHPAFAWIALTPLLVALSGAGLRRSFFLGLLTGLVYFTGTLYWITGVMAVYGALQTWVAVLINAALVAYLALLPALFALITRQIVATYGRPALISAPIVWVATELGRTYLPPGGFPWVLLGYSQTTVLPIAQFASIFGVYGVSMLVAAVSATLAMVAIGPRNAAASRPAEAGHYVESSRFAPAAVVLALVLVVAVWGSRRVTASEWTRVGEPIRVGMIQGNVDQAEKWDAARASTIFQDYLGKTQQAIRDGAQLVLWPESSTPFLFEEDPVGAATLRSVARQAQVPILFGSDQIERRPERIYNSAFLVNSDGTTGGVYRKIHLVPFGEYVPMQRLLFFAAPLTEQSGSFSAGVNPALLPVNGHPVSVAICYEVVYSNLVRSFVVAGSELLATITNDAWFGRTSAPVQHFQQASMRAIENGRYLVRSANTGISGIVDPYGRVLEQTSIFQPAVLVGEARFLKTSTFYSRHGDVLAYASALATAVLVVLARRVK